VPIGSINLEFRREIWTGDLNVGVIGNDILSPGD
jgi:hypothetical protein